jgi:hypothetical protein
VSAVAIATSGVGEGGGEGGSCNGAKYRRIDKVWEQLCRRHRAQAVVMKGSPDN